MKPEQILFDLWATTKLPLVLTAAFFLLAGYLLARLGSNVIKRATSHWLNSQQAMLLDKVSFGLIFGAGVILALQELGLDLKVLLGAAGILTVAIGFASQTSASNLISGLFLIGERPFAIGDYIMIGSTMGEVLSIDLLSIKLRTFDNIFVRIPNETVIKTEVMTLTRFPIRRVDVKVGIAYKEDLAHARQVLMQVAADNPSCLEEPKPVVYFLGFGDSSLDLQFSTWVDTNKFMEYKTTIMEEVKKAFDQAGIEIPFPHRSLYTGSVTDPLPIRLVGEKMDQPVAATDPD